MIASYYNISKRKKTKGELIQDIVLFETDPTNFEITQKIYFAQRFQQSDIKL